MTSLPLSCSPVEHRTLVTRHLDSTTAHHQGHLARDGRQINMFSCCICRAQVSGMRKARKETFFNRCRRWLNPPPRRHCQLVREFPKDANVSPVQSDLEEYTGKVGAWENFLEHMVAAVEEGNQAGVSLLVFHYWPFRSTQRVLDRVSKRYGDSCTLCDRDGGGQECLKIIFSCILLTWLHEFPDDFCETPHFPSLKQLVAFTQMALPGSTLERQSQLLLSELEPSGPSETQTQEQKAPVTVPPMPPTDVEPLWPPELLPPSPTIITPAPEREAALISPTWPRPEAASSPDQEPKLETSPALPAELAVALMPTQLPPSDQKPVASLDLAPAASPPEAPTEQQEADQVPTAVPSVELQSVPAVTPPEDHSCSSLGRREQGLRERKVPVLAFPPRLLAEQLTQMDVELFRKVVAFDCVQAISTLCSEKCEENLAPTIYAVITQMHLVSNCVITTCLSGQSTTASDRARILERWVEVARVRCGRAGPPSLLDLGCHSWL
ncbi:ral guanine nucleotide dissociation stimulator-like isoform X2 [Tamandua tetradactyla]|uniref:ral guanine nucleotide dissociation stimulator-like isoform X2 n=1 Tax=Tamandua tetradactyla TaxID=48850 RepID=UPI0040538234